MNYKLIAIDLDGTLLNDDTKIPNTNKIAIKKAIDRGVHVIISSGRGYKSITNFVRDLDIIDNDFYGSAFHGSCIFKINTCEIIEQYYIDRNVILEIFDEVKDSSDIGIILYKNGDNLYTINRNEYVEKYYNKIYMNINTIDSLHDVTGDFIKMLFVGKREDLQRYYDKFKIFKDEERCNVFFSSDYLLEFTNLQASKGSSLRFICDKLGIHIGDTIGIGDNHNDIDLIKEAGLGVAMKNGVEEAKEIANYITINDNNNSGVAEVINKFILNN